MKTLVIYAHPSTPGHCAEILKQVKAELKKRRESFEVLDLYDMRYDAVMHEDEHYTTPEHRKVTVLNQQIQQKISQSNNLIFIYPIWWNAMPAILKGFMEKVFTPKFAFSYVRLWYASWLFGAVPMPLLKGKRAAVLTTSSSKTWVFWLFEGQYRGLRIMIHDTLGFFGIKAKNFHLGGAIKLTDANKAKIRRNVVSALNWLY